jgi:hypothetical protein
VKLSGKGKTTIAEATDVLELTKGQPIREIEPQDGWRQFEAVGDPVLTPHRDATYPADTQAKLIELHDWLVVRQLRPDLAPALRDVIDRWEANDATEIQA